MALRNMLTEIPRLLRQVKYINPSDTNRIIDLRQFDVSQQFDRLYVLTDLIKACQIDTDLIKCRPAYQAPSGDNDMQDISSCQIPLPNLVNNYHSAISKLEEANSSNIIKLNKPLHMRDINWETVSTSYILGNNTEDFVFNMGTRKGWLNPSVQEHIKYIYLNHNIPPWVVDNNLQVPENISDAVARWRYSILGPYRYPLFVHGPKLLYNFDTNDHSFTNYTELMQIDNLASDINKRLFRLRGHCMLISNILAVEHKINKAGNVENLVKKMDLKTLIDMCFPGNASRIKAHSRHVIKSLIEATLEVPGGKEYMTAQYNHTELSHTVDNVFREFADRNYMGDPNNIKILESIIKHPLVDENEINKDNLVMLLQFVQLYLCDGPVEFLTDRLNWQKKNVHIRTDTTC